MHHTLNNQRCYISRFYIWLFACLFLILETPLRLEAAESRFGPVVSACKWRGELLLSDWNSVRYAVKFSQNVARVVSVTAPQMEAMLLVAEDAHTGLSARLVQGQKRRYVEVKHDRLAQNQILDIPPGCENADPSRLWLFALDNKIYFLCANKDQILYAVSEGSAWQVKAINLTVDLPAWAAPRFKRQIFLSRDGIYCACYAGEWGHGVIYFNFDRQVWQKVFEPKTESRMVVKGQPTGSLWIITSDEIRQCNHGEVVSEVRLSALAKEVPGKFNPTSYYLDASNDLYLSSDSGAVFELARSSLVPILTLSQINEIKEAKQVRNGLNSTIRYVGKDFILYVLQDGRTLLFDRVTRKLLELTLSNSTMTL